MVRKKGIDYYETEEAPKTNIRHGVISQRSVMEGAMDDFYFQYPKSCPYCGEDDLYKLTDLGFDEYRCDSCKKIMPIEEMTPDEPTGFHYDKDGYFLVDCLGGDILILRSDFYTFAQVCTSGEVGAGNLDIPMEDGVETYALGHDWFEGGVAPYPVYRVLDGGQIVATEEEIARDQREGTERDTPQRIAEVALDVHSKRFFSAERRETRDMTTRIVHRGKIAGFSGTWNSGIGYLVVGGTIVPCENTSTIRALDACFGNFITDGRSVNNKAIYGKDIVYFLDEMGLILEAFTPTEDWIKLYGEKNTPLLNTSMEMEIPDEKGGDSDDESSTDSRLEQEASKFGSKTSQATLYIV